MTITNDEHEIRSPKSDVRVTGTSLEPQASSLDHDYDYDYDYE